MFHSCPPKWPIWRHQQKQLETSQLKKSQQNHPEPPKYYDTNYDTSPVAFVTLDALWEDLFQSAQLKSSGNSTSSRQGYRPKKLKYGSSKKDPTHNERNRSMFYRYPNITYILI